jgi:hypothetical protein
MPAYSRIFVTQVLLELAFIGSSSEEVRACIRMSYAFVLRDFHGTRPAGCGTAALNP